MASESLLNIINDILDFSKIRAGNFTMEKSPFVLDTLFDQSLSGVVALRAEEQGSRHYDIGDDSRVLEGDPSGCQVLINLVTNAVKFSAGAPCWSRPIPWPWATTGGAALFGRRPGHRHEPRAGRQPLPAPTQADSSTTRQYGGTGLEKPVDQPPTRWSN